MRLLVLSDLHLDIWRGHHPKTDLAACKPDVVILAGDIHSGAKGIKWAAETFPDVPVLYVMGNHESYGHDLKDVEAELRIWHTDTQKVFFLNKNKFELDGVRFLGCTLWTDFCLFGIDKREQAMCAAHLYMVDYQAIKLNGNKLYPEDTELFHALERGWLNKHIQIPFEGQTVVITHMAPSMLSVADRYRTDLTSAAFASNLDCMTDVVDLWIHGHTHDSFDYKIGECRVVCNPCGYPTRGGGVENSQFDPNLIIEI